MHEAPQKRGKFRRILDDAKRVTAAEWEHSIREVRDTKFNVGLFFAIFCVLIVIIGNVILLIALNFWLSIFPAAEMASNSSQMAVQVIVCAFLVMCFMLLGLIFLILFGFRPLWRALTDTNRVGSPLYRLFLLFASGATNGITGVLGVYSMSHTPEFVQAVLLSVIPFCAQAWTYLLVREERRRRYLSVTLIISFLCFVAGVLLSSMSSFLNKNSSGEVASWEWALVYLASAVVFGLWCVVQRLYLDAILHKVMRYTESEPQNPDVHATEKNNDHARYNNTNNNNNNVDVEKSGKAEDGERVCDKEPTVANEDRRPSYMTSSSEEEPLVQKRQWGKQNEDDYAAKTTLLLVGILFQTLVSFALLPVDAIPWFGTSQTVAEAWRGFRTSCNFIFESWENVQYGMLHTLGYFMSFLGCVYLNERSPTLASVVLQLAGPVTSIVLIIVPKWDVYGEHGVVGHKVGGVILLLIAGLMYHIWDQASLHELSEKQSQKKGIREDCAVAIREESKEKEKETIVMV